MKLFLSITPLLVTICFSCGSVSTNGDHKTVDEIGQNYVLKSTREVFKTLPSPIETANLIKDAGVNYDEKILNPTRNAHYYEASHSMALNMGVYCTDLSYTTFYDQKKTTMEYLSAVKTMADGLGLKKLLDENKLIKLEDNLYNRDSIKLLVDEVFFSSGELLNDNNRPETALLIQVGGWIEGIYLGMQLAKQSIHINKVLVDRVADQRSSLLLVIESLENFKNIPQINDVLNDMNGLKSIYDKMILSNDEFDSSMVVNLTKDAKYHVTRDVFMELFHKVHQIRNGYTL